MILPTASLLAFALTFLSFNPSTVVADTTTVAPIAIDQAGWDVRTDSANAATGNWLHNAFDDNTNSFWHTTWNPTAPMPHYVYMDMKNQYVVNGFNYLPRQDGGGQNKNGNIGQHTIELSADGANWTTVASGSYVNDQTLKSTLFTATIARYVRLNITSEAQGNDYPWASAAEFNVLTNPHSTLQRTDWVVSADSAQQDQESWEPSYAIDGSPNSMWHTQWINGIAQLPHWFTIDQGVATSVGGISYLPRIAATGANGRIGQYKVQRSSNGNTWIDVVNGTWADTATLKFAEWTPISARWWRLVALSEAGNRGPWTSAGEINLLDGSNALANFVVTVDSEETVAYNNQAINALDGDITTFWHTQWQGTTNSATPFPHVFSIDMLVAMPVKGLKYLPRQDGQSNGNIGQFTIDVSLDNIAWTTVALGQFADNNEAKYTEFQETNARYVRLRALSEAGNRGPWASAAEIAVSFDVSYIPPAPQTVGQWALTIDFPMVPVAMGLIASTGGVVAWSASNPKGNGASDGYGGRTLTATFDPTALSVTKLIVTNTQHDMFCPGISMDFKGRIVVSGGGNAIRTSVYEPSTFTWFSGINMKLARGYQSSTTLSNGYVFTIGGSWAGDIALKPGEIYDPVANKWTLLPNADVTPMLTADKDGLFRSDNHGWLFGWKNAFVFQAGPSNAMNWYNTSGDGSFIPAGTRLNAPDAMCGIAVMYDAVAGKILAAGGSPNYDQTPAIELAYIITIGDVGVAAQVEQTTSMKYKRIFANAAVLPNGQILVAGGQDFGTPFLDDSATMYPELWDPITRLWTVMAPMTVPRVYHSTALLLPDATVLVAGGGLCDGCQMNHYDGQVFKPPYLFTPTGDLAPRPIISAVSANTVPIGGSLQVTTTGLVTSFSLIRMGTATHSINTDQRRIPLTGVMTTDNVYTITVPSDAGIALPGYWMLFANDALGVPSVAQTIKVTLT
jgi:galactose oxidase